MDRTGLNWTGMDWTTGTDWTGPTRPSRTLDGTDLIRRVFNDPDLVLCHVTEVGPRRRSAPGEGNLDPTGPQLQAGWVPTLRHTSLGEATHTSSVTEVVEWVQTLAPSDQPSPVQSGPVQSGPVQSGPVQSSPVQSGPVQSGPVRSGPVRSTPVQSGPLGG
jgi:hypothetical protein